MVATKMEAPVEVLFATGEELEASGDAATKKTEDSSLQLKDGYMYRESNWEIGRAAEKANITVRKFKPGDRWTAWKKKTLRKARAAERRRLGGAKKPKQNKKRSAPRVV